MKHRPQGSLGDGSCQDLIEFRHIHASIVHLEEELMEEGRVLEQSL